MRDLEAALKAAGDPTRTRILKLLEGGALCVCQIQEVIGLAPSTISKHLAILKGAGLVEDDREGRWIRYALAAGGRNPFAQGLLALLRGPLDREPQILDDRGRLAEVLAVPLSQLCARQELGRPAASAESKSRHARAGRRAPAGKRSGA